MTDGLIESNQRGDEMMTTSFNSERIIMNQCLRLNMSQLVNCPEFNYVTERADKSDPE